MGSGKRSYSGLKICGVTTAILFVTIAVVLVILFLTIFKPKEPKIIPYPVILEEIRFVFFPVQLLNVTLGVVNTIDNTNYGSFKYEESTADISYRGNVVGGAPIEADEIPARGKHNISTSVTLFGDKLLTDDNFKSELKNGLINFTSASTLHGKVTVLRLFKARATSSSTCDISIFVQEERAESVCKSEVRL